MPAKFRLHYFNGHGRGEVARLILGTAGLEFDDVRIDFGEWPNYKKRNYVMNPTTPDYVYETIPLLEFDSRKIAESRAICRFLARHAGLMADSALDNAVIDEIADAQDGMMATVFGAIVGKADTDTKVKTLRSFRDVDHKKFLSRFEFLLSQNNGGTGFLVGNKLSWGDLVLLHVNDYLTGFFPTLLNAYPRLKAHHQRIRHEPRVKAYLQTRQAQCPITLAFGQIADKI